MAVRYFVIDTMKESRDNTAISKERIYDHIQVVASLSPTHVAIDCFMDYQTQFRWWVEAIRAKELPIVFRLKWWGWEFSQDGAVSPSQFIAKTVDFIKDNISYFKDGDIFDVCAEPEEGDYWVDTYGDEGGLPYTDPNMKAEYNQFIQDCFISFQAVFDEAGLDIVANHCSHTPGSFLNDLITDETAALHRWITCDSYPDSNILDPDSALQARLDEMAELKAKYPSKELFITEMGYSLSGTNGHAQAQILAAELPVLISQDRVVGISYWNACGFTNNTEVFIRESGRWAPRPAAKILCMNFCNKRTGGRCPL